ncbi:MAG: hypothetical protein CMC97_02265 [Flavobacteriales bacterium]|nr:hypothetical protein [Flavobacteriales bacterium]
MAGALLCASLQPNQELPVIRTEAVAMAKKKKTKELQPNIKVRLDGRTVITVRDPSKLDFWREKYPKLEILEEN